MTSSARPLAPLFRNRSGVAAMEFAFLLPILLIMFMSGTEIVNYIIARMRVSQLALHVADNAARMGEGTVLSARRLREMDINDLLTGAGMQAEGLDIYNRGRIILSSFEPMTDPGKTNLHQIKWQRCRGLRTAHRSAFGQSGKTDMANIGPTGQQVRALPNNPTMYVEVFYEYRPIITGSLLPGVDIKDVATMAVRERRDTSQVYNTEGVPASTC